MDLLDLARLTPRDFEELCHDLFEEILGLRLETFGPGPDGGIGLRGWTSDGGLVVVQCKHWERSARSLLDAIRRDERPKVERLDPARYLLATTADPGPAAKDRLVAALHPYVRSPLDVYLRGDIVAALRKHPHLIRRHARLWFRSADALAALVDRDLFVRARDLAADMKRSLALFVPGRSYTDAVDRLERHHVCVVSGLPGYGKTTLAHALAGAYAADGYEVVAISEDPDEVDRAWSDERKQVFVGDDFLATARGERRRHQSTARLLRVVERVGATEGKRLVLTSREYVLAQARDADERLHHAALELFTVSLDEREYGPAERERIARNAVAHSRLPDGTKAAFLDGSAPAEVAAHRYFNPAVLETGIRDAAHGLGPDGPLGDALLRYLDDPSRMWWHVVENQLDDAAFDLLVAAFSFGSAPVSHVRAAWEALRRHAQRPADPRAFDAAVRALSGSMLRETRPPHATEPDVTLYDEVVAGFAKEHFGRDPVILASLFDSAVLFEQVENLWDHLCPHPGVAATVVAHVRENVVRAVLRTLDSKPVGAWGSFLHRTSALADVTGVLRDRRLVDALRDRLRRVDVMFAPCADEDDLTGLHLVASSLVLSDGFLGADLRTLLLPAIRRIGEDDVEEVYCLAAFVEHLPELPKDIRVEAERKVRHVVDAALRRWLAGTSSLDDDARWRVEQLGRARGLDVPD